jgi:hypothetical protein
VCRHVDLNRVVAEVDLDALVSTALAQVDLAAIANQVLEDVDLADLIRDSSGALASDTVRVARIRSAAADQALGRVRDRLVQRRARVPLPQVPGDPAATPGHPVTEPTPAPDRS